jgi:hypothetical protein
LSASDRAGLIDEGNRLATFLVADADTHDVRVARATGGGKR